jgi:hypothetical protein
MRSTSSARLFSVLGGGVSLFQLALVAGAPWGALTQGGRVPGVLPIHARLLALLSAIALVGFVHVVRSHAAGRRHYPRAIKVVVAYCVLGVVANAATPSSAERQLWLPVVTLMLLTSAHVARRAT